VGKKQRHKRSGILAVRTAPAPTILFRKDGARTVPLAHEPPFDEILSIRTLRPASVASTIVSGFTSFPGVLEIANLGGTSGCAESIAKYHNSNW
jgi:hypothetical protein